MGYFVKNRIIPSASSSIAVPSGGSASRPVAPVFGSFRFNTDIGALEVFNGTTFDSLAISGVVGITIDSFVGDGSTSTFSLSIAAENAQSVLVFIGGLYQEATSVYTITGAGNDITFSEAVPSDLEISVIHGFANS